jgi:hypothetical protein
MKNYRIITPLMSEISAHTINAKGNNIAEAKADALIGYNSSRAHDGLPPLEKLPRGTRVICEKVLYIVMNGQEIVSTLHSLEYPSRSDMWKDARYQVKEYNMAHRASHEIRTNKKGLI